MPRGANQLSDWCSSRRFLAHVQNEGSQNSLPQGLSAITDTSPSNVASKSGNQVSHLSLTPICLTLSFSSTLLSVILEACSSHNCSLQWTLSCPSVSARLTCQQLSMHRCLLYVLFNTLLLQYVPLAHCAASHRQLITATFGYCNKKFDSIVLER